MKNVFLLAVASILTLTFVGKLQAEIFSYEARWENDSGATAVATFSLDDQLFFGDHFDVPFESIGLSDFEITIAGAASGNGTFTEADFSGVVYWDLNAVFDFSMELFGQKTPFEPFGTTLDGGDFNIIGSSVSAPTGTLFFQFTTDGGNGEVLTQFSMAPVSGKTLVGDVNCDGVINLLDVGPFVDFLLNGGFDEKADVNEDGIVNLLDVEPFIALLAGN